MASPLSPTRPSTLNIGTPPTARRDDYEVQAVSAGEDATADSSQNSSPFVSCVTENDVTNQENISPSKSRHSRVLSGNMLSPLKILAEQRDPKDIKSPDSAGSFRSPRKVSPPKRFPVKVSNPMDSPRAATTTTTTTTSTTTATERTISLEEVMKNNQGLKRAIEIFEDDQSDMEDDDVAQDDVSSGTVNITPSAAPMDVDGPTHPDDTMISTFSDFSAIPDTATLTKINESPARLGGLTPRANPQNGPSPQRTPKQAAGNDSGNNTTNLLDFTDSLRFPQKTTQRGSASPSRAGGANVAATPSRQPLTNLIDFDIPPMPTPRSVPSISAREVESLKSNFLSEISSLKASLSGKEAEVKSLKAAVGDAEKRVGESMEKLRDERVEKEQLAVEKDGWENRGREMESVLRKVKHEIQLSQKEREELEQKLDESEKRREAAEMMHQEAESKMAGMRAGKESEKSSPDKPKDAASTTHEIEIAVERVARELHALYKSKHETKVTALKKSYEARWEKKMRELEGRIEELTGDNERLREGRDATMTKVEPDSAQAEELKAQAVRDSAAMKELNADVQRLEAVIDTVQKDNENLRGMLERERVEKGELVQLAEEMMSMQSIVAQTPKPRPAEPAAQRAPPRSQLQQPQPQQQERPSEAKTPKRAESLRNPNRVSGLRAPGSGLRAPHERNRSAGGLPRPAGIPRSGIMNSIERMGNYRGRHGE